MINKYFLLRYISPGVYSPPVKSLRSTEYGSGVSDGVFGTWFGTISVVTPQASGGAPSGRPCTDVIATSNITAKQYIKFKAYILYRYRKININIYKHIVSYV